MQKIHLSGSKEIYFHVGLGKVASTYLQYAFFPKLQGIDYIQRTKYRHFQKHIDGSTASKVLISREMDNQLAYECEQFAAVYPDAKVIIAFRQHDGWIASQYRRYVKNGGYRSFSEFFDVDRNTGLWKTEQVIFMDKIKSIEQFFHHKPLVLFHEDLKNNPFKVFDQIASYIGASYDKKAISTDAIHASYNERQLKFIRSVAQKWFQEPNSSKQVQSEGGLRHWIRRRSKMLACYATMYSSALFPDHWVGSEPLILEIERAKVRDFFAEDWKALQQYAKTVN